MSARVSPDRLKAMLRDGGELALLDVREEGAHAKEHLLYASCLPLSRLELRIADLVPRQSVPIVLCDGGDSDLAERAAATLAALGYTDVSILDGGTRAWADAGHVLFSGVHVPSKAFGEFVEHRYDTPRMTADALKARLDAGEDILILDSRPLDEFRVMNIPGGVDCPGAELVYRVHDAAPSPTTQVVVNCAGRTRSIIGAQSLINAGIPNPVAALKDGTMGWHLAGHALERGQTRYAPEVSAEGLARAREAADRVARRFGVRSIDRATLERWRAEAAERSLYVLDVRRPEEYEAGHLPGSLNAPGGQLVQETEVHIGTLGARVVLVDDTGVRATMTASWLVQLNCWEVAVLTDALAGLTLATGPHRPAVPGLERAAAETIAPQALRDALKTGETVAVDLAPSRDYGRGHIPGAWFAVRARLADAIVRIPPAATIALTSPDGVLARLAAPELAALSDARVVVLDGGTGAWAAAGLPLADGFEAMADEPDDTWLKPYDHDQGVEERMRVYLSWEVALVDQIERDGDARFRFFPE